jgi:hypothetical protein
MQGEDEGTPHIVAVDAAGIILARMKGAFGEVLKDIAVDTNGIMVARMKGAFGAVLKDIALDTDGSMLARMQGRYSGAAKDMALDVDGNMKAAMTGDYEGTPKVMAVDSEGKMLGQMYGRNKVPFNIETFRHCNEIAEVDFHTGANVVKNAYAYIHGSGSLSLQVGAGAAGTFVFNKGSTHFNYFQYISFYYRTTGDGTLLRLILYKDDSNYLYKDLVLKNLWTLSSVNIWSEMIQVGTCNPNNAIDIRLTLSGGSAYKTIGLDWMRSHFYDDFVDDPKPLQVNEYGGLPMYLMGLYEGSPTIINCDIDGNMNLNIKAQDLDYQTTKTYGGTAYSVGIDKNEIHGGTLYTLVNVSGSGTLDGGWLRQHDTGAAGMKSWVKISLDGVEVFARSIEWLKQYEIDNADKSIVYYAWYDEATKIYRWAFRQNVTFEVSLLIQFINNTSLTAETLVGNIDYHLM